MSLEICSELSREFQKKGPKKANTDLAKECLTRVKKKWEQEDNRKPGRLAIEDRSWSTFSFLEALMLCSMRCSQTASCVAYNFFSATNQCQLFNQTLNKFSILPGCHYYLKKDLSAFDMNMTNDVDDELREFYINGKNISIASNFSHVKDWTVPDIYHLKGGVTVRSQDNYILTNSTWKCSMNYTDGWYKIIYNDSFWPASKEYLNSSYQNSIGISKWITESNKCEQCIFHCRKRFLGVVQDIENILLLMAQGYTTILSTKKYAKMNETRFNKCFENFFVQKFTRMYFLKSLSICCLIAKINVAYFGCYHRLEEDNVSFCSCDPAIEDRSWSTFSFIEALMLCSMRCSHTASCVAYNFFNATNQCQLFNQTLNKFSVMPGCQYYLREVVFIADRSIARNVINITVDNELREFYFNGNNISVASNFPNAVYWNRPDSYNLEGDIHVLALKMYNNEFSELLGRCD
ncbi:hypothetical protein HELRODRAFT_171907 [Helobdella robusta]|uniref:Apple domain-containing protein n=1 Tax=Helobdella robusta TaxID=6412 RepID=T1F4T8_HELRO|nr:hypothetical protein HELRODRAFT_171907 [Helobdella robusta]ESO04905.1 hypothetical protein HELRODRAFT_171907 [Helobdella robusta]